MRIHSNKHYNYSKKGYQSVVFTWFMVIFINATMITDIVRISFTYLLSNTNIATSFRNVFYSIIFMYMLYYFIKYLIPIDIILMLLSMGALYLISYFFTPEILQISGESIFYFISRCVPAYFFGRVFNVNRSVFKPMRIFVNIALVYTVLILSGFRADTDWYMTIAENLFIPLCFSFFIAFFKSKKYYVFFIFLIIMSIVLGSRGIIFSILVFAILIEKVLNKIIRLTPKKILIFLIGLLSLLIIALFYNEILNYLYTIYPNSRTLSMLIDSDFLDLSNRDYYYSRSINIIMESPLSFRGLFSDRVLFSGNIDEVNFGDYAHNIFFELYIQFGIIIATFLISILTFFIFYSFKIVSVSKNILYIMFFCIFLSLTLKLLFSGSYLSTYNFWFLLGLIINIYVNKNKLNVSESHE